MDIFTWGEIKNKIIISYYGYNVFCLILSITLIYKLDLKIMEYNIMLYEIYSIYSVLISGMLGYLYIDYLSNIVINIYNIKLNKLTLFLAIIFSFSLILTISALIINLLDVLNLSNFRLFNPILNDGTNSENTQANSNSQSSGSNANQQTNQNRQVNSGSSNHNIQINVNNQDSNVQSNINFQHGLSNLFVNTNEINTNNILFNNNIGKYDKIIDYGSIKMDNSNKLLKFYTNKSYP